MPERKARSALALQQAELQLRRLGHHALVPLRIPDELDVGLFHLLDHQELVRDILLEHGAHTATGRSERHLHVHLEAVGGTCQCLDVAIVDEAEILDVHRDSHSGSGW